MLYRNYALALSGELSLRAEAMSLFEGLFAVRRSWSGLCLSFVHALFDVIEIRQVGQLVKHVGWVR